MSKRLSLVVSLFTLLLLSGTAFAAQSSPAQNNQQEKPSVKVVHKVAAVYPEEAQREGVEGKVLLEVTVEASGEVSDAKVLDGHRLLRQAALDAIKQWRFSNTFGGPVTIQITFKFGDSDTDQTAPAESKPAGEASKSGLRLVHKVNAVYPEEAKRKRVQGEVAVEITVNEKGEVTDARAKSGDESLRQAAIDAVRQFRFENTLEKTVAATITFNFTLGSK